MRINSFSLTIGPSNECSWTPATTGDVLRSSLLCGIAHLERPAFDRCSGDGWILSWQHDRPRVRGTERLRVLRASRSEGEGWREARRCLGEGEEGLDGC
jgi:hypothetical protein